MTLGAIPRSIKRPTGEYRQALAATARTEYERGKSINDLAETFDRSYSFARRLLLESGVVLRPPGTPQQTQPGLITHPATETTTQIP